MKIDLLKSTRNKNDSTFEVVTLKRKNMSNLNMNSDLDGVYSEEDETMQRDESGISFAGLTPKGGGAEDALKQFNSADKRYKVNKQKVSRKKTEMPFKTVTPRQFFASRDGDSPTLPAIENNRMDLTRDFFPKPTLVKKPSIIMPQIISVNTQLNITPTHTKPITEKSESQQPQPKPPQTKQVEAATLTNYVPPFEKQLIVSSDDTNGVLSPKPSSNFITKEHITTN